MLERDFVLYVIECTTAAGTSFQIERRFSDFVTFHERVSRSAIAAGSQLSHEVAHLNLEAFPSRWRRRCAAQWIERVESPYAMLPIISRLTVQKNDPMVILDRFVFANDRTGAPHCTHGDVSRFA